MFLTEKDTNQIFDLCISLLHKTMQKCDVLWEMNSSNKFRDILNVVNNYTIEKLKQNHSVYLRMKHVEQHNLYVPPLESAIGTHWEMQKSQF